MPRHAAGVMRYFTPSPAAVCFTIQTLASISALIERAFEHADRHARLRFKDFVKQAWFRATFRAPPVLADLDR
jgi:hypothetical protein